jgi:anaerobic nitric oxide reductase flavorubredoxin
MAATRVAERVYWVGADDHTTDLFEGLWPVQPAGVSYNAYVVEDEQPALIDPVGAAKAQVFLDNMSEVLSPADLRYIVLNHMEQDHTGSLNTLRAINPDATIICTERAVPMLESFYGITENVKAVADGEELSLGDTTLRFVATPFVHWPETMMTYDVGRRILFSCDAFGTFGTLDGSIFADESRRLDFYEKEGLRYYANVVAKFSKMAAKAIQKLDGVPIDVIAPSHGPVWREDPGRIVDWYTKWAGYAAGPAEPIVCLAYASMYGFTERMARAVAAGVVEAGVPLEMFDAGRTHPSFILASVWKSGGILLGAPTYEGDMFPPMRHLLDLIAAKGATGRKAGLFGSYGWAGGAGRRASEKLERLQWHAHGVVQFEGCPTAEDLARGRELGRAVAAAVATGG